MVQEGRIATAGYIGTSSVADCREETRASKCLNKVSRKIQVGIKRLTANIPEWNRPRTEGRAVQEGRRDYDHGSNAFYTPGNRTTQEKEKKKKAQMQNPMPVHIVQERGKRGKA